MTLGGLAAQTLGLCVLFALWASRNPPNAMVANMADYDLNGFKADTQKQNNYLILPSL